MIRMSARQYSLAKYLENLPDRTISLENLSELNQLTIGSFVKRGWIKENQNHRSVRWTAEGSRAFKDFGVEEGFWRRYANFRFSAMLSLEVYDNEAASSPPRKTARSAA